MKESSQFSIRCSQASNFSDCKEIWCFLWRLKQSLHYKFFKEKLHGSAIPVMISWRTHNRIHISAARIFSDLFRENEFHDLWRLTSAQIFLKYGRRRILSYPRLLLTSFYSLLFQNSLEKIKLGGVDPWEPWLRKFQENARACHRAKRNLEVSQASFHPDAWPPPLLPLKLFIRQFYVIPKVSKEINWI